MIISVVIFAVLAVLIIAVIIYVLVFHLPKPSDTQEKERGKVLDA